MTSPALILHLCEQLLPSEKKVENYVAPLVEFMTDEWKSIKIRLADYIVAIASGENPKPLLEAKETEAKDDIWFPIGKQNLIYQQIDSLLKEYKKDVSSMASDIEVRGKIDANPPGLYDWKDTTPIQIKLSREGVEELVKELQWQKDFVDDYKADVKTRVRALTKSRYGSVGEFRQGVNRTFRIDRDRVINSFKVDVQGFADSVIDGKMNVQDFVDNMRQAIDKHYKTAYMQGKGVTSIDEIEEQLINRQVTGQMQYLNRFGEHINTKQVLGKELTSQIRARAGLYAERGSAIFEAGAVSAMPADVLLDWKMNPAEHCTTCPIYASNSPYTKATLPGYPGEGFHLTKCGTNCKCNLMVSDLYVTQRDLGI